MNTFNESQELIDQLNSRIRLLEKQKDILFTALDIMSGYYCAQNVKDLESASDALRRVQIDSLSAMKEVAALNPKLL